MANRFPLQRGDVAPDLSDYNFSNEADRRADQTVVAPRSNPHNYHGEWPAADQAQAEGGRLWKCGQMEPNDFLSAPFPTILMDGDNNGSPAEVREIDIDSYGDAYDVTSPLRVRMADNYNLDSDHDGKLN
jgi:hypothetical protein